MNTRAETGAMKFGSDWPGVFIRGDNAAYYAMNLEALLEEISNNGPGFDLNYIVCKQLLEHLRSCIEPVKEVQILKEFDESK